MAIDYVSTQPVNLQEAVRDLDARLKAIEHKPAPVAEPAKPTVTERVDKMLDDVASHKPVAPEPAKTTAPVVAPAAPKV